MKRHQTTRIAIVIAFVVPISLTVGCTQTQATAANTETARAQESVVDTAPVRRADLQHTIRAVAELAPRQQVSVRSLVSERVVSLAADEGDEIEKGAPLASVRRDNLKKSRSQIDAQIDALDVQLEQQRRELERAQRLQEGQVMTSQNVEQIASSLAGTEAQRRGLKANRDQLSLSLRDAAIKAPIGGVIVSRHVEVGDIASPQTPLFTILDLDVLAVELRLAEADAVRVSPGQQVELTLAAYPGEVFHAAVTQVSPVADPATRTVLVEGEVDNARNEVTGTRKLRPGMFARAELVVASGSNALVAPLQGLQLDDALLAEQRPGQRLRRAYVVDQAGRVEARRVEVGQADGVLVQVLSGLQDGESIVVRGLRGLRDGDQVRVQYTVVADATPAKEQR